MATIVDQETDARFWAQSKYKPGHKLDPKDPTDAKMIPIWMDIYKKVKAEDAAGKLVLTYNHPVVAQHLADAHVADKAAAMHLDAAATAPDPQTAQQNIAAAATAAQVASQKTREAAQLQPPTVSPQLAHAAAQASDERTAMLKMTNKLFWESTGYKPGQKLDPKNPQDVKMMPVWMRIFEQVQRERLAQKPPSARDQLAQEQAKSAGHRAADVHRDHRHRRPVRSAVHPDTIKDFRVTATRLAHEASARSGIGSPFVIVIQHPDGTTGQQMFASRAELDAEYGKISEPHDQYKYVAAFDLAAHPAAPIYDSVGIPAAEHADVPPPAPPSSEVSPETALTAPPETPAPSMEKPKWSAGKVLAIAAALTAVGGFAIVMARKSSRTPARPLSIARAPKVFVATSAAPTRVVRATPARSAFPTRSLRA